MFINDLKQNKTPFATKPALNTKKVGFAGINCSEVSDTFISTTKKAGLYDKWVEINKKGLNYIAQTKLMQKLLKHINIDSFNKHFMSINAVGLTSFYILNIMKSKEIEKDRKKTLAINMAIVGTLSTILGYSVNERINKVTEKFIDKFAKANPDINYKNMTKGMKAAQGIIIFSIIYRFIAPVIATPLADRLSKLIKKD